MKKKSGIREKSEYLYHYIDSTKCINVIDEKLRQPKCLHTNYSAISIISGIRNKNDCKDLFINY